MKPKPMKPVKAWAVIQPDGTIRYHGTSAGYDIFEKKSEISAFTRQDKTLRIARVLVTEVD